MPDEDPYPNIGDTDTVFIKDPNDSSVGSCLGRAFKDVYATQGYTQVSKDEFDAHMAVLDAERDQFVVSGRLAPLPEGDLPAQDIINAERSDTLVTDQSGRRVPESSTTTPTTGIHAGEG